MQLFKGSDQSISCKAKGESNWWKGKKEPLPFDLTRQIYHHQMEMKKQITQLYAGRGINRRTDRESCMPVFFFLPCLYKPQMSSGVYKSRAMILFNIIALLQNHELMRTFMVIVFKIELCTDLDMYIRQGLIFEN